MVQYKKECYTLKYISIVFLILFQYIFAATIDTIFVYSESMDTTLPNIIVVPDNYLNNSIPYPVLYLLHGWSGDFSDWNRKTDLGLYADKYDIIIVCPEGGYASWYLDSPVNPKSQFKTFVGKEIVNWLDRHYRTVSTVNGRAICGLSMGGHGALYLGMEFPETFGAAGSMSGVLDLLATRLVDSIYSLLGETEEEVLEPFSLIHNAEKIGHLAPNIIIDCGTGDKYLSSNRALHDSLIALNVPHTYFERAGGHSWEYWTTGLPVQIQFFSEQLEWGNR